MDFAIAADRIATVILPFRYFEQRHEVEIRQPQFLKVWDFGFDTFEGLPEKWGTFAKGSMSFGVPELNDDRHEFFKGLFQHTLVDFLKQGKLNQGNRKIIHLDADLFSSTLFVLTTMHPYLRKDDIILFDEFNVPNHEFLAFEQYTTSFYVNYEVIGAVNNYFQLAIKLK